jgi:Peptidase A4 family
LTVLERLASARYFRRHHGAQNRAGAMRWGFDYARTAVCIAVAAAATVAGAPPAGANVVSQSEAGYELTPADGFTTAAATVGIPQFTCQPATPVHSDLTLRWHGEGPTTIATFSLTVNVDCTGGGLKLSGIVYEADTSGYSGRYLNVASGDVLTLKFQYVPGSGAATVVAKNVTHGKTAALRWNTPDLVFQSARFVYSRFEDSIPTFSEIALSGLKFDGTPVAPQSTLTAYDLHHNAHRLVHTTAFNGPGGSFKLRFVQNT